MQVFHRVTTAVVSSYFLFSLFSFELACSNQLKWVLLEKYLHSQQSTDQQTACHDIISRQKQWVLQPKMKLCMSHSPTHNTVTVARLYKQ